MYAVFEKKRYFRLSGRRIKDFRSSMPMFHPHGELVYVTRGAVPVTVDGERHLLKEGEVAVVFPYLPHAYEASPEAEAILLLFDPAQTAFDTTLLTRKPVCFYREGTSLYPLMDRAVDMLGRERPKTAMAYVNAVLGELLELLELTEAQSPTGDVTLQLLSYCAEHFTQEITVRSIAQALFISESYVSKIFSGKLKCSCREYVNGLRVQKAQSLLEDTELRIGQIMAQCGFHNQSSFNRVFREFCGISPKAYRYEYKKDSLI